jgi:hypothetical protein
MGMGLGKKSKMDDLSKNHSMIINGSFILLACVFLINMFTISQNVAYYNIDDVKFDFINVQPPIQLLNEPVIITCILNPLKQIPIVYIDINTPNEENIKSTLSYNELGKFQINLTFKEIGKYSFFISTYDDYELLKSSTYEFWITTSLDDIDDDKIPDWWEEKYNMNPKLIWDASSDYDNDGYTNLEEYTMNTNPLVHDFIENNFYHLKQNSWYVIFSFLLFLLLIIFSIYGFRRSNTWQ